MCIKGTIYGLYYNNELKYIGSTTYKLNDRLSTHLSAAKTRNSPFYTFLKDCDRSLIEMRPLEECECETNKELVIREGVYIEKHFDDILNSRIEWGFSRNSGEYNKRKVTCKCGMVVRSDSIRDHLRSKRHADIMKNPYLLHEVKVIHNYPEYTCSCGSTVKKKNKSRHQNTQKHINLISNKK